MQSRKSVALQPQSAGQPKGRLAEAIATEVMDDSAEALQQLGRYKRLTCPEDVTVEITRAEARIRVEWLLAGESPRRR
jgi:hypothetical protein